MPPKQTHVIIIGGGASGVLLACHLLKKPSAHVRVTLIEKRADVGTGIAYGTANRNHLLNVRASNMSAYPEDPDHFWRWLLSSGAANHTPCPDPFCFVPRPVYGQYIASLLDGLMSEHCAPERLCIVQGECVSISETGFGVEVKLADGSVRKGDLAVLATGNEVPALQPAGHLVDPWSAECERGIAAQDTVLILGTGLTMVDHVLTLIHAGHRGPIIAMSRRGLLPQAHRRVEPWPIARYEIPFGQDISKLLRWIRALVRASEATGGDWRSVIDGLRPYTQELWQRLPQRARVRFLEHARAWWDVHRHRMAPEVETTISALLEEGRLTVIAGRLISVETEGESTRVSFRRRGAGAVESVQVQRMIECRGVDNNPARSRNPVLCDLLRQGLGRPDPLHLGLEVTNDCAIVDVLGKPSQRLFAIGPLTRPVFWEIIAVPDIRVQCAKLADLIGRSASQEREVEHAREGAFIHSLQ